MKGFLEVNHLGALFAFSLGHVFPNLPIKSSFECVFNTQRTSFHKKVVFEYSSTPQSAKSIHELSILGGVNVGQSGFDTSTVGQGFQKLRLTHAGVVVPEGIAGKETEKIKVLFSTLGIDEVAAIAFFAAGALVIARMGVWQPLTLGVGAFSLILCVLGLPESRIGIAVNVVILIFMIMGARLGWLESLGV